MGQAPSERHLSELRTDLQVERAKLSVLVESLASLQRAWDVSDGSQERCDAAALRLQSLYTGIERCFVQIVRVLNGGPPDGADWHRRLLDRMTVPTEVRPVLLDAATARGLAELMRFRQWCGICMPMSWSQSRSSDCLGVPWNSGQLLSSTWRLLTPGCRS